MRRLLLAASVAGCATSPVFLRQHQGDQPDQAGNAASPEGPAHETKFGEAKLVFTEAGVERKTELVTVEDCRRWQRNKRIWGGLAAGAGISAGGFGGSSQFPDDGSREEKLLGYGAYVLAFATAVSSFVFKSYDDDFARYCNEKK